MNLELNNPRDFALLLQLAIDSRDALRGEEISEAERWKVEAGPLSEKLVLHCISIKTLSEGISAQPYGMGDGHFLDHSSASVLARAALETYIVFHFLYAGADCRKSTFRHSVWKLIGLMDRSRLRTVSDEGVAVQTREKIEIEDLRNTIQTDPLFSEFTPGQQKTLLEWDWKAGSRLASLALDAELSETYFRNVYNYLTSYAHSGYISVLQIGQARAEGAAGSLMNANLGIGCKVLASFIPLFWSVFPSTRIGMAPITKSVLEKWSFRAEDMERIYARNQKPNDCR